MTFCSSCGGHAEPGLDLRWVHARTPKYAHLIEFVISERQRDERFSVSTT